MVISLRHGCHSMEGWEHIVRLIRKRHNAIIICLIFFRYSNPTCINKEGQMALLVSI